MEEETIREHGAADGDPASASSSSPTSAASENPLEDAAVAEGAAEASPTDTPRNGPGDCARAPMSPVSSHCSSPIASIRQQVKHMRSGSFQKWRRQMQRAWRWGPGAFSCVNPDSRLRWEFEFPPKPGIVWLGGNSNSQPCHTAFGYGIGDKGVILPLSPMPNAT